MTGSVGSNGWAALGGQLQRRDRVRLVAQALLTQLSAIPVQLRSRLGFAESLFRRSDPAAIRVPDSTAAVRASELSLSLSEPWLFNHCMRTYVWGGLLAQAEGIRFDQELFFVASLLHDLGLTRLHDCKDQGCNCFAVEGARAARRFASVQGWDSQRCDQLAEAISMHLNVRVGLKHGAEAHLLHEGAALDVIGTRVWQLDPRAVAGVLTEYPRLGFQEEMVKSMKAQTRVRPRSRAAFLVGLGLIGKIRSSGLEANRIASVDA